MTSRQIKRIPKNVRENNSLDEAKISDNLSTPVEEEIEKIAGGLTAFSSLANAYNRQLAILKYLHDRTNTLEQRVRRAEIVEERFLDFVVSLIAKDEENRGKNYKELMRFAEEILSINN